MRAPIIALLLLGLAACSQSADQQYPIMKDEALGLAPPPAEVAADASAETAMSKPAAPNAAPTVPAGVPMLAYSYRYGIDASPSGVRKLMAKHEAACVAAGLSVCQLVSSSVQEAGPDQVTGVISLRAAPGWLRTFRGGLASDAKSAGGRVVDTAVDSEDLSRQIVDTEAALRAKTTLRDRLQSLLASRPGKLGELIELERELARVQGELDATQSELAVMRARVAMSEVTINYASSGVLAPRGVFSPLGDALSDVLGLVVATISALVRLAAVLVPLGLIGWGLVWVFRKPLRRMRERRRAEREAAAPPTV